MSTESRTAYLDGDVLFIKLNTPYKSVSNIEGYSDSIEGEDTLNYFVREFRWSRDNESYSDWTILTDTNLQDLSLNSNDDFWIQYKYTAHIHISGHTMTFNAISLEVVTVEGIMLSAPLMEFCEGEQASMMNSLVIDDCCPDQTYNPYDYGNATNLYEQLSCLVAKIFGLEVTYWKTDPAVDTRDTTFKEWSLNHVVDKKLLKIQMADGELPTREQQFDALGMNSMDMFEVHIVKSVFQGVFGEGTRPREGDFLYFPVMDRVYEINSIAIPDDPYYKATYYRAMLTDWQKRSSLMYDNPEDEESINAITKGLEDTWGEEIRQEEEKVRIPKQYNTIYSGDGDYIRKEIDKNILIKEQQLRNNFTIISKYYYDLTSIAKGNVAAVYRDTTGIAAQENRAISFWINPQFSSTTYPLLTITSFENDGGFLKLSTAVEHRYSVGDAITLSGCGDVDGTHLVLSVTSLSYTINTNYTSIVLNTARSKKHEECHFMSYTGGFYISLTDNAFIVSLGENDFIYNLYQDDFTFNSNSWYGIILNYSNEFNQLSLFIWEIEAATGVTNFNINSELKNMYTKTISWDANYILENGHNWELLATNIYLTNIRVFKAPIEIEEQSLVLSRYVETDSHLALIIDNAIPGIRLIKKSNAR